MAKDDVGTNDYGAWSTLNLWTVCALWWHPIDAVETQEGQKLNSYDPFGSSGKRQNDQTNAGQARYLIIFWPRFSSQN